MRMRHLNCPVCTMRNIWLMLLEKSWGSWYIGMYFSPLYNFASATILLLGNKWKRKKVIGELPAQASLRRMNAKGRDAAGISIRELFPLLFLQLETLIRQCQHIVQRTSLCWKKLNYFWPSKARCRDLFDYTNNYDDWETTKNHLRQIL